MSRALIALGGNLGDVVESFHYAIKQLGTIGKVEKISALYQTVPVGGPEGQPAYLNAAVKIETDTEPQELMKFLLQIEAKRGRERRERWGARTLDLDLLDYDGRTLNTPALTLPHPRMWERAFVVIPLHDIEPDYIRPETQEKLADQLLGLDDSGVSQIMKVW